MLLMRYNEKAFREESRMIEPYYTCQYSKKKILSIERPLDESHLHMRTTVSFQMAGGATKIDAAGKTSFLGD